MTPLVLLLLLVVAAVALLSIEALPVDVIALGILVTLLVTGVLGPGEALRGFGNEAVVALAGLFVLTAGLRRSGAMDGFAAALERIAGGRPRLALPLLLAAAAGVSAFINNTTCTALFLPVALAVAPVARLAPSQLLMPLAFASILGGSITVIGTSTNVIIRGLLPQWEEAPLSLFELLPVALPVAVLGLAYLLLARRMLPPRADAAVEARYPLRAYLAEVVVEPGCELIGTSPAAIGLGRRWGLEMLAIVRRGEAIAPASSVAVTAGDTLVVEGSVDSIAEAGRRRGVRLQGDGGTAWRALRGPGPSLIEVVLLPRSELLGRTLAECGFRQRYGGSVIALNRHAEVQAPPLAQIRLRVGDGLLVLGDAETTSRLHAGRGLLVLGSRSVQRRDAGRAALAGAIFAAVVLAAAVSPIGLVGAVLGGCLALLLARLLTPAEAYAAVDWRLLVLIAGMMAYGRAMEQTGAATLLAQWTVELLADLGPRAVLAGFYGLTLLLTQPMSNQAAALVVFPVAMEAASELGISLRAMAVTVAMASSSSFLTPLEPSCLLVYGPGGYRFGDFAALGAGLTVIAMVTTLLIVPVVWPL